MDKPNLIESYLPKSGQYSAQKDFRLNVWLLVATAMYLVALFLNRAHPGWGPWTRACFLLIPVVPLLLYIRDWVRLVRGMDELQRGVQMSAYLFASLGTVLVGIIVATVNSAGIDTGYLLRDGLGFTGAMLVMWALWVVGLRLNNRRFK